MKMLIMPCISKAFLIIVLSLLFVSVQAQDQMRFWDKVRFGGSIGAGFGTGYTNVSVAPAAIYEFNQYVGLGLGIQGSYINNKGNFTNYTAFMYGGSLIGVLNPIPQIQLSAELEQLRVNLDVNNSFAGSYSDNFWNTALFLGAGYRADNVIIGARYNVLFDEDDFVYSTGFMPFVRLYF